MTPDQKQTPMILALSLLALLLVAVTMGLSFAHALEFPGKLRLDEKTYRAVQAIYYPGFTIGGLIGEFGSMLVLSALLFLLSPGTPRFWWVAGTLGLMVGVHAIYWVVTHPVNSHWLKGTDLDGVSSMFFGWFASPDATWTHMRNVWEWSHVARAIVSFLGFLSMTLSIAR
ncbi:hypothetical protein [Hydrogenophaga sp.]|uniref:hypothetical protein n=2 Tax=unclassified Hydrogenophaga TaxID=2610897 RepID=UPI000A2E125A|nr:hypothetical protein CAP37_17955 [Hydrogenophaga sp. IBVHS1]